MGTSTQQLQPEPLGLDGLDVREKWSTQSVTLFKEALQILLLALYRRRVRC
jgi:hypothetical protein